MVYFQIKGPKLPKARAAAAVRLDADCSCLCSLYIPSPYRLRKEQVNETSSSPPVSHSNQLKLYKCVRLCPSS
jgi:hypothetical protein